MRIDTGENYGSYDIYSYTLDIADFVLTAGTYYFSVEADVTSDPGNSWWWNTGPGTGYDCSYDNGVTWEGLFVSTDAFDFTLFGTEGANIYLPGPLALMLTGLGLLGFKRT